MTEQKPIRVKDLSTWEFLRYLELSRPEDLEVFGIDSNAELLMDPYGLPPTTVRSKEVDHGPFPMNVRRGHKYYDTKNMKTWCYNGSCWIEVSEQPSGPQGYIFSTN
ncbi:hypothetical protein SCRM01_137c [Synechococcus phage S-CRM01]|uniref:hypothetical protein n=1 Tax=Synechococcus phage S-CRM01 TaxID=1026955 RepID=UPI000209E3DA|nr:hypothetical protein SCRM01_137c [Synechococcus phage S-CRM01]AEC53083.1 hypothetical protein SCRM01_137c [Synechococcus phage S-CRM01]